MQLLDARDQYPDHVAPTRDWHKITANDRVYREEPFQLSGQRLPVSLRKITRPMTFAPPQPHLPLQRVPVSIRSSNQRPIEQGTGQQSSTWRVSDPGWHDIQVASMAGMPSNALPGMSFIGATDTGAGATAAPAPGASTSMSTFIGLGVVAGLLAFAWGRRKG